MQRDLLERVEALEERNRRLTQGMETLEKRNRRLTLAVGALVLVLVFGVCFAARNAEDVIDVLRVNRLEVVDPDGETRATFEADPKKVQLMLGDEGEEHIELTAETSGDVACVSVGNEQHLELYSEDSDRTGFLLFDKEGDNLGLFEIFKDGQSGLSLFDASYRMDLTFFDDGRPSIGLFKENEAVAGLLVNDDGKGYARVNDPETGKANWLGP
ncbi:MAG: hypothetical protein ACYC2Y_10515 [Armatimonadota bacterium]